MRPLYAASMTLTARPVEELPVEYRLGEPVDSGAIAVIIQNRTHWVAFLVEDINTLVNKDIIVRYMSKAKYSLEHPPTPDWPG